MSLDTDTRPLRRGALITLGWLLTAAGVLLFPLPGPGLLLLAAGLWLLAEQYPWAERHVHAVRHRALVAAARGVVTPGKTLGSVAFAMAMTASGGLWLWKPDQPSWWVLPSWTWLPGGSWAGTSQVLSGLVTLALVGYAWRRFHGRPDLVAELRAERAEQAEEGGR